MNEAKVTGLVGSVRKSKTGSCDIIRLAVSRKKNDSNEYDTVWFTVISPSYFESDKLQKGQRISVIGDFLVREYQKDGNTVCVPTLLMKGIWAMDFSRGIKPKTEDVAEDVCDDIPF